MRVDSQFSHDLSILKYNFDYPFFGVFGHDYGFLIMRVPKSDAQRNV